MTLIISGYTEHVQATTEDGTTEDYQLIGTGSFDACVTSSIPLLNLSAPCPNPPCLFSGVHQPPMRGYFQGIDNFAKALVFFGLPGNYSSSDLAAAGRNFCAMDWCVTCICKTHTHTHTYQLL